MKPAGLGSRIFLDGGDPDETRKLIDNMGFLDGQTTNPTFVSRNPEVKQRLDRGEKFTEKELLEFYRNMVTEISEMIPEGSVSIEVYADGSTSAAKMLEQGRQMFSWIPNAHIKFPCSKEGLKAASGAVQEGIRVNLTLCFLQEQAAAVYGATLGAARGDVFVSPFVGRLDDRGERGMDLIENILQMYQQGDGHVMLLSASLRNLDHFMDSLRVEADILTAKYDTIMDWVEADMPPPEKNYRYQSEDLRKIPYLNLELDRDWQSFDLSHPETSKGMEKFSADWNSLLKEK